MIKNASSGRQSATPGRRIFIQLEPVLLECSERTIVRVTSRWIFIQLEHRDKSRFTFIAQQVAPAA